MELDLKSHFIATTLKPSNNFAYLQPLLFTCLALLLERSTVRFVRSTPPAFLEFCLASRRRCFPNPFLSKLTFVTRGPSSRPLATMVPSFQTDVANRSASICMMVLDIPLRPCTNSAVWRQTCCLQVFSFKVGELLWKELWLRSRISACFQYALSSPYIWS